VIQGKDLLAKKKKPIGASVLCVGGRVPSDKPFDRKSFTRFIKPSKEERGAKAD